MPKLLTDLPADMVGHIVVRVTTAHHIGRAAPTCKVVSVAARDALWEQRFSDEVVVVPIPGHPHPLNCVDATFRALLRGVASAHRGGAHALAGLGPSGMLLT